MKLRIGFLLVMSLFLINCKSEKKAHNAASKMEEVMRIHDEVMPKMGQLGKLVGELKPMVDSTENGKATEEAVEDLQQAHKAMMDWMTGFGNRFDSEEILNGKELSEQKKQWLEEEEEKVKALREQINRSIEKAEKVLEGN